MRCSALYLGHSRRSNSLSAVRSTAFKAMAVAATMQSGSLILMARRSVIASFFTAPVRPITEILSEIKARSFSYSSGGSAGLANNSISVIALINRSALLSSSCRPDEIALPLVVRKMTALVSSTKRFSVSPFVPEFPLVRYSIAVGIRRENAEIPRNWRALHCGQSPGGSISHFLFGRPYKFEAGGCSRRHLRRNLNIQMQPAAGGYFNYLFDYHAKTIA